MDKWVPYIDTHRTTYQYIMFYNFGVSTKFNLIIEL